MNKYLEIGKIVSVFGLKGEVKVHPWCDTPDFLCEFDTLYYKSGTPVVIKKSRVQKNIVIMKIEGIDTVDEAQKIRNRVLYMNREDVELDDETYFVQDLLELKVIDFDTNEEYGKIIDVTQNGAHDVYHIQNEIGKMYYIPAIADIVKETNIDEGFMKITPLKGLFD